MVILLSRLAQRTPFKENIYPAYIEHYFQFFSNNYMALFIPITFCFWCFGSLMILRDEHIILRCKSRFGLFITYVKYVCADALLFTALLFITAMSILLFQFTPTFHDFLFYGLCFLLQFVFFAICSLLFLIFFLLFSKSYVAFVAVVCYGAADFVITYGRISSGWHNISTQLLIATSFEAAIVNLRLYGQG